MQDQVIFVSKETETDIEKILWMDLLAFESLHDSVIRLKAIEDNEFVLQSRLAQHGDKDAMRQWEKLTKKRSTTGKKPQNDQAAFLRKFGGGF